MKTLSALVEREGFEVPPFALDHFQRQVREELHLEFFLERGRLLRRTLRQRLARRGNHSGQLQHLGGRFTDFGRGCLQRILQLRAQQNPHAQEHDDHRRQRDANEGLARQPDRLIAVRQRHANRQRAER